ncbi:hypothetical protein ACWET9_42685 [Streptomyces sp. NPDC004059]
MGHREADGAARAWKTSRDPGHATGTARVEHLHTIADGEVVPESGEPDVICPQPRRVPGR